MMIVNREGKMAIKFSDDRRGTQSGFAMDFLYVDKVFLKPEYGFGENRPFRNGDKKEFTKEFTLIEFQSGYYVFDVEDRYGPLRVGEVVQRPEDDEWVLTGNWFSVDSEKLLGSSGMPLTCELVRAGTRLAADAGLV